MNVDDIRAYCLSFPEATENLQWGDDLCFKIRGKIFAMVGLDNPRMCFKCAPETFAELIEREDIRPAPYVGRYQWVMVDRLDALAQDEMRDLIAQSYGIVSAKAPKKGGRKSKPRRKPTTTKTSARRSGGKRRAKKR
jgi:predicted DNA-binding protein (MmcQ/YjbR family)